MLNLNQRIRTHGYVPFTHSMFTVPPVLLINAVVVQIELFSAHP